MEHRKKTKKNKKRYMNAVLEKYMSKLDDVSCNLCNKRDTKTICDKERFGLPLTTVICKNCGLIYINPRPTKELYTEFYTADYRKVVSGTDEGSERGFSQQVDFARKKLVPLIKKYTQLKARTLLDIGCSYGGIIAGVKKEFPNIKVTGIEPVKKVADFASYKTNSSIITTVFEDVAFSEKFDLILCIRTLNHSLDPRANLSKIRDLLKKEGIFLLVLYDAISNLLNRPLQKMTEMTHPFIFARETINYFVDQVGLEIIFYKDTLIDAPSLSRIDYHSLQFAPIIMICKRGKKGCNKTKSPDWKSIYKRIRCNCNAYQKNYSLIKKWQSPNLFLRVFRKIMKILRIW
ncbi:class I SAM-dependent methyltransferase [Chlamydiota bacterium]